MKYALIFCFAVLGLQSVHGQTKADLIQCLELAFDTPQMQELMTQEWGELRTLYVVQENGPNVRAMPFYQLLNELDAQDFFGFPYEIELITREQEIELRRENTDVTRGLINISGFIRENKLTLNIGGPLPGDIRKSMIGSFVLEQSEGNWEIIQSYVQKNP